MTTAGEIILDPRSELPHTETNSNNERQQQVNIYEETRGTLHYMIGAEVRRMDGHFIISRDQRTIVGRKIGGSVRWRVCSVDAVVSFDAYAAAVK